MDVDERKLASIMEIKDELRTNGPVISTSFLLQKGLYDAQIAAQGWSPFDKTFFGKIHPVLIIGWEAGPSGEMWLIQGVKDVDHTCAYGVSYPKYLELTKISVGQFDIDKHAIAPATCLDDVEWAPDKNTADVKLSEADAKKLQAWQPWQSSIYYANFVKLMLDPAGLEAVGQATAAAAPANTVGGLVAVAKEEVYSKCLELRVEGRIGISRRVRLTELEWKRPGKWEAKFMAGVEAPGVVQ